MLLPYLTRAWPRYCLLAFSLLLCACGQRYDATPDAPSIAVSIAPLKAIMGPLLPGVEIHVLTPRGASPHTHEPKPSDAARAAEAMAVFYVEESLDGWVTKLDAQRRVAVFEMVPEELRREYPQAAAHDGHDHGHWDPHFWNDPLAVKAILPRLAEVLTELQPNRAKEIRSNAQKFASELDALDAQAGAILSAARGGKVAVFHHAIDYMLARYGMEVLGAVEPSPGQTPGPRTLNDLAQKLKAEGAKAVFTEPQLSPQAALSVAEQAGIPVVEVDPEGGIAGRETYRELLLFNARAIASVFP